MNVTEILFLAFLFFVLTPNQFLTLPSIDTQKEYIALTHALIFALIYYFTNKPVVEALPKIEL